MKRIRVERPKRPRERDWLTVLPLDPHDPDVLRAKAIGRSGSNRQERLRCHGSAETRAQSDAVRSTRRRPGSQASWARRGGSLERSPSSIHGAAAVPDWVVDLSPREHVPRMLAGDRVWKE